RSCLRVTVARCAGHWSFFSLLFFSLCSFALRDLPSFPTRRSSDLVVGDEEHGVPDRLDHPAPRGGDDVPRGRLEALDEGGELVRDRKSTRLNSSHVKISYAVFCLKKKKHS